MRRLILRALVVTVLLGLAGCGKTNPEPVEKTDPLPKERFPRERKK